MKKILELRKELMKKCDDVRSPYLEQLYCIDVFFECRTADKYRKAKEFCESKGYARIFDIGCAFGFQSEVFLGSEMDYVGIDGKEVDYHNKEEFMYISQKYPFKIEAKEDDIAISFLCLGWNCYLHEEQKTLNEQFKALSKDFNSCILDVKDYQFETIQKYFPNAENIGDGLHYFYKN